mgnify:CR=1 FL=1
MKCFEQKEVKEFSFKDNNNRKIWVTVDWSLWDKVATAQQLNIDIIAEDSDKNIDEVFSTEINLEKNLGFVKVK